MEEYYNELISNKNVIVPTNIEDSFVDYCTNKGLNPCGGALVYNETNKNFDKRVFYIE